MIWEHLGFQRNIFFVEPLRPYEQDIQLFVSRNEEVKNYLIDTLSDTRALKVVSGDIGVGKTSFVNACQYFSYTGSVPFEFAFDLPSVLPCFEKIQLREEDTFEDIVNQTITSLCQSIVHHCKRENIDPPNEVKQVLSYFLDLAISSGGSGISGGATVLGTGAQFGKTSKAEVPNPVRNARVHLKRLVELARTELGFRGVFVNVNNLDILSKSKLIQFVNVARDELFDIDGIYWTLIGRKGIGSIIETEAERVADYLSGTELFLRALDYPQIRAIIEKRVVAFRKRDETKCPLSDETIRAFYYLSVQELRETLHICGEITKAVLLIDPSFDVIPSETAMKAFSRYAYERAKDLDLTESRARVLKAVFGKQSCRPKDFEQFGYSSVQGFIVALKALVGKRLLSVEERGRARIYRMTGMTMIAAITGALGSEIQEIAVERLQANGDGPSRRGDRFADAQLELELDDEQFE